MIAYRAVSAAMVSVSIDIITYDELFELAWFITRSQ